MKIKYLSLSIIAFLIVGMFSLYNFSNDAKYTPREKKSEQEISGAIEWINARKVNPQTGKLSVEDVMQARRAMSKLKAQKSTSSIDLEWTELGPDNVGGRTRAVLFDINNANVIYAGGVGGGLWKSTTAGQSWKQIKYLGDASTGDLTALQISAIAQTPNGDIYFGTGEMFMGSSGQMYGNGIWKSTDGETFTHLVSSWGDNKDEFYQISRMASDPFRDRVYVTCKKGLRYSDDGGATWVNPISNKKTVAYDVKVGTDGSVVVAFSGGMIFTSDNGDNGSFTQHIISTSAARMEIAIAPSDPNYIYIHAVRNSGNLLNLYRSTDKGANFEILVPGAATAGSFNPTGNQGTYDVVIAVSPTNKNRVILGGLDLYYWDNGAYGQLTQWFLPTYSRQYVHADQHALIFSPHDSNILFVGSDGGLSKSVDGGLTYSTVNKGYNVTQFYSVAYSGDGKVCGGAQDNGTQLIDFKQNTHQSAVEISGGDGAYAEMSSLSPGVVFSTTYYGSMQRREGYTGQGSYFYSATFLKKYWDSDVMAIGTATPSAASFVTPIALWETTTDYNSIDSATYVVASNPNQDSVAGSTIRVSSLTNDLPIFVTLENDVHRGDTLKFKDPYQAMLAIGMNGNVWVNRKPLDFTKTTWESIIDEDELDIGKVSFLVFSKDGNNLFFADGQNLYRASNFENAHAVGSMTGGSSNDMLTVQKVQSFGSNITGISVDPQNPNNVVVTLGGYNSSSLNVYYSTNAATATQSTGNFVERHGNLPKIPVYSAVVNWNDSRQVIIGTEFGVFSTDNILDDSPVWNIQNKNLESVPVLAIRQQQMQNSWITFVQNHGHLYIGTHGRGIFTSATLKGPTSIEENPIAQSNMSKLNIFPNPAKGETKVSFVMKKQSDVNIMIYSVQGRLVKSLKFSNQEAGAHIYSINLDDIDAGTYIVNMLAGKTKKVSKLMVY